MTTNLRRVPGGPDAAVTRHDALDARDQALLDAVPGVVCAPDGRITRLWTVLTRPATEPAPSRGPVA